VRPKDPINEAHEHADAATRTLRGAVLDNPARQASAASVASAELEKALAALRKVTKP